MLAMIDEQAEESLKKLDSAQAFAERTEVLVVDGESPDGMVTVSVDATGHAVRVDFHRDFHTRTPAELGQSVMAAQAHAQRRLSYQVEQIGKDVYGEDSPTARTYADAYRSQYGYEED